VVARIQFRNGGAVIAAVFIVATFGNTGRAAASAQLSLVKKVDEPAPLVLVNAPGDERTAKLALLVRNASKRSGSLGVRFFVAKSGAFSDLRQTRQQPVADRPVLSAETKSLTITRGQTRLLQLDFTVPKKADPSVLDGVLVITLGHYSGVTPLVVRTRGVVGTRAARGMEVPEPPKPALIVTSLVPFWHGLIWGEHQHVEIPAKPGELLGRHQTFLLGSDSGGLLRLTLSSQPDMEGAQDGLTSATLRVSKVGRSGTYDGDLALGPRSADKLTATVHVRDFFFWAFFVLGLGALLGGFGTAWWENWRRRALLLKRAKDAHDVFAAFVRGRPADALPPAPDANVKLWALEAAIGSARSDNDYDAEVDAVASYERELYLWRRLATAADGITGASIPEAADALSRDREDVIEQLRVLPEDEKSLKDFAERAERLAEIVSEFSPVWLLWERWGDGDELVDPTSCYHFGAYRHANTTLATLRCLAERKAQLLQRAHAAIAQHPLNLEQVHLERILPPSWRRLEELPPAAIGRVVRSFDWVVALASGLVTLLAILLTLYGRDYGSLADYAKTFTAGFLGQLAGATIAWNLFPPLRSYRAEKTAGGSTPNAAS
jgi:hypothetical protein